MTDPVGEAEALAVERLARLPGGFLCFSPPGNQLETVLGKEGRPEPGHAFSVDIDPRPPEHRHGCLTLGTFNNGKKIDIESALVWGAALSALPDAKLLLKGKAFQNPQARENLLHILARGGIEPERVELRDGTPSLGGHLAQYNDIDIALDTFPYNGTTTTCEALWMGVPVVTLAGKRHASRVGASLLGALGRREWIASTADEFTGICVRLAQDPDLRQTLRRFLRREMLSSRLMDEEAFVATLEEFFRSAWSAYCSSTPCLAV